MSFRNIFSKKSKTSIAPSTSSKEIKDDNVPTSAPSDINHDPLFAKINKQVIANTMAYCNNYYSAIIQELDRYEEEAVKKAQGEKIHLSVNDVSKIKQVARIERADLIMKELQGLIVHTDHYPSHRRGLINMLQNNLLSEISEKLRTKFDSGYPLNIRPENVKVLDKLFDNFKEAFLITSELDTSTDIDDSLQSGFSPYHRSLPTSEENEMIEQDSELSNISHHSTVSYDDDNDSDPHQEEDPQPTPRRRCL